jgi:hypothetical protein
VASTFGGDSSDDESSSTTAAATAAAAGDSSSPAAAAAAVTDEQRHTIVSTANWIAHHPDQADALRQNALELSSDDTSGDNSLAFLQDAAGATAQGKLYLEALAAAKARGEVMLIRIFQSAAVLRALQCTATVLCVSALVPLYSTYSCLDCCYAYGIYLVYNAPKLIVGRCSDDCVVSTWTLHCRLTS